MTLLNLFLKKITNYNTPRIVQEGARTEIIEFFKKAEKALTEENIGDKFIRTVKKAIKDEANVAEEVNIVENEIKFVKEDIDEAKQIAHELIEYCDSLVQIVDEEEDNQ